MKKKKKEKVKELNEEGKREEETEEIIGKNSFLKKEGKKRWRKKRKWKRRIKWWKKEKIKIKWKNQPNVKEKIIKNNMDQNVIALLENIKSKKKNSFW